MDILSEDPSALNVNELKSILIQHGVQLPVAKTQKPAYVQLFVDLQERVKKERELEEKKKKKIRPKESPAKQSTPTRVSQTMDSKTAVQAPPITTASPVPRPQTTFPPVQQTKQESSIVKNVISFVLLSFGLSWSWYYYFKYLQPTVLKTYYAVIIACYMWGPAIAAIILHVLWKEPKQSFRYSLGIYFRAKGNRFTWKWGFIALLAPIIISLLAILVALLAFPNQVSYTSNMEDLWKRIKESTAFTSDEIEAIKFDQLTQFNAIGVSPILLLCIQALVVGTTINAIVAFGEELGWRGYLFYLFSDNQSGQSRQITRNFWKASLFIGFVWGLWHVPLLLDGHNYQNYPLLGALFFPIWCMMFSPIITYLVNKCNGSALIAAIIHGTINAVGSIHLVCLKGGNDFQVGVAGIPGLVVMLIINFFIWLPFTSANDTKRKAS